MVLHTRKVTQNHTWPGNVSARTWAVLLPRPGKRLGIAPSFPQIWALSPGLPTDWALPPDTGDCPRGPAHLQQRPPPPHSSRSLPRLLARPRTQLPASSLQPCGELPAASAAPAGFPVRRAAVPPGLALASCSRRGQQDGAQTPAEGFAARRPRSPGPGAPKPAPLSFALSKITVVGKAPRWPRSGEGRALSRRDAEEKRTPFGRRSASKSAGQGTSGGARRARAK
ncbi:insulin-like growth factor II isoform X1 [Meles meles]|uniref:insulin-like growth factor II isoform X1 n=1 Tax=Meles meles TaxID=9662 RepID=UPI001E69B160|nr:insulin-like growth factor II isoform X1 [Meles meles]